MDNRKPFNERFQISKKYFEFVPTQQDFYLDGKRELDLETKDTQIPRFCFTLCKTKQNKKR